MRQLARRAWRQTGFRGTFLLLAAVFDVFYGWYLTAGGPLEYPRYLMPERTWGLIWLAVAAVLVQGALSDRDWLHFALATALATAWGTGFFILQRQHGGLEWTRGAYFLALALIVLLVSAWPEPPP